MQKEHRLILWIDSIEMNRYPVLYHQHPMLEELLKKTQKNRECRAKIEQLRFAI